jgi:hypothetical protein
MMLKWLVVIADCHLEKSKPFRVCHLKLHLPLDFPHKLITCLLAPGKPGPTKCSLGYACISTLPAEKRGMT